MTVCMIVQARMNSQRLPDKVLKKVLGRPLLGYEIERLRRVTLANKLIVATSLNAADDAIDQFCREEVISCFRGDEDDVLSRFYEAAKVNSARVVVRICADCPLIDPAVVDKTVRFYFKEQKRFDYVSNVLTRTYPRGMDCEVFSFKALEEAHLQATHPSEREHVTSFIYNRPDRYRLGNVQNGIDQSAYRWTVDTQEDFELIQKILSALYPLKPAFGMSDVLELYVEHPEWKRINERVQQRSI